MMNTIVVTGATSMIGLALIKQCIQHNVKVIALVRPGSPRLDRLPCSNLVTVVNCSLDSMETADVRAIGADNPEVFYHFGWEHTDKQNRHVSGKQVENIRYTLNAVHLAKKLGCGKFVGAGSQAEYGCVSVPLNDTVPVNPDTAYGAAKYAAGKLSKIECAVLALEHIWVRILSVYGNNDNNDTLISRFITSCKNNDDLPLGPCSHIWDYLYEDDAGRAFFTIGERGIHGKVYCLGSGIGRSLKEYLEIIRNIINPMYMPQYGKISYGPNSVRFLRADISELTGDTGWKPDVSFECGINHIVSRLPV